MSKFARFAWHQAGNLTKLLRGRRLRYAPLVSATLDMDDVSTARDWLRNPERWSDDSVVTTYESEFAAWNGSRAAFAFMGGRVALSACLDALGLGSGDDVIVPAYTCVVVANALKYAEVRPIFADIELETYGLDVAEVERRITSRTRAIIVQHTYGIVCRDYEAILDLAKSRNVYVIEDCAHATGAEYRGVKVGNRGHVGFYSSERSKVFNTVIGGVAVTNDIGIARRLAAHSQSAPLPSQAFTAQVLGNVVLDYYRFKHRNRAIMGELMELVLDVPRLTATSIEEQQGSRPSDYGTRMPAPVAELGRVQLRKIDAYNQMRRRQARKWADWSRARELPIPKVIDGSVPVFLRYPLLVGPDVKRNPAKLREELGVDIGVWFRSHLHPVIDDLSGFERADHAVASCINLPTLMERD